MIDQLYQMLLVAHVLQDSVFYGIYLNVCTISHLSDFSFPLANNLPLLF